MPLDALLPLLAVLTVGLLTPGPDFVLVLKNGLRSPREGRATVLGITLGLACQMAVLVAGFAALGGDARVVAVVRYAGAAVLLWLGFKLVLAKPSEPTDDTAPAGNPLGTPRAAFTEGLVCNLTNPKAFVFFASLFARFQSGEDSLRSSLVLALAIVLHGFVCWSLLTRLLQIPPLRSRMERWQAPLLRAFGVMLLLLGASAALGK